MAELLLDMPDSLETMSADEINSQPEVQAYWVWLGNQSLAHRQNPFTSHWVQQITERRRRSLQMENLQKKINKF